jgi:Ca-activated chloride channel family protein
MNLLNTPALLYLLTIPPVVLLYFLRLRRKNRVVASTLLWQDATADLQANAPFQRLRKSLLLFLQILLLALLAVVIARPFLTVKALTGESQVIVIDASASMQATDETPSRLAAGKRAAGKIVADLSQGDEACIIEAGSRTRVRAGFTANRRTLRTAIDRVEADDSETRLGDALALAASLAAKKQDAEIVLVSDGAFEPLDDLALGGERLRFVRVGKRHHNVGITAMDARRDYSARGAVQVFLQMTSFIDEPTSFVLEIYHNDSLVDARPVELPALGTHGEVFSEFPYESGLVRAHIDLKDDLAADNSAFAYLLPRRDLNVLLVGEPNLFLEKALAVDMHVQVTRVAPSDYRATEGYDITILDGWAPKRLGDGSFLLVHAAAEDAPVAVTGEVGLPIVVGRNERHPVTRHASFEEIAIADALTVSLRPWGQVLVEGDSTPLVVCGQRAKRRVVYVGFSFERSNLPLRAAFPILIQNCLAWLGGEAESITNRSVRTGDTVRLPHVAGADSVTVKAPGGAVRKTQLEGRSAVFDGTDKAGLYRARYAEQEDEYAFVANLLSRPESDLAPRANVSIGGRRLAGGEALVRANREIWRHLAVLALLILAVEWYAYHRRI